MPLFKTKQQVSQYITVADANTDSGLPKQIIAEQEYLVPILGKDLLETLQIEADTSPDVADASELLQKVWAALAFLMYYKEMPFLYTRITDSGLKSVTNDKVQGAYFGQYKDLRAECEEEGLAALERLLVYLADGLMETWYTEWQLSDAYKRLNKNLIKDGATFTRLYNIFQPHRTFHALQPLLQEVEDLFISKTIGADFFKALKEDPAPNDEEKLVLDWLQKAAANFTIHKSCTKLAVRVRREGITVMLSTNNPADQGEGSASQAQINMLREDSLRDGNTYLNLAVEYLNENASNILFADYFNSSVYVNPDTEVEDINDTMDGVFAL